MKSFVGSAAATGTTFGLISKKLTQILLGKTEGTQIKKPRKQMTRTPETTTAWECDDPLLRLSDKEKRELCEKMERERDAARDTLFLAARWGISSDGYSAEVSSRIRCWIINGMKGEAPQAPNYYPQPSSIKEIEDSVNSETLIKP